MGEMYEEILK